MSSTQHIRATWFASTVGTAAACMVLDTGRRLCGVDGLQNIVLFVVATITGGIAASRYMSGARKWFPCVVIGFMMTVRLYDPFLGPTPERASVQIATLLSGSVSAYF